MRFVIATALVVAFFVAIGGCSDLQKTGTTTSNTGQVFNVAYRGSALSMQCNVKSYDPKTNTIDVECPPCDDIMCFGTSQKSYRQISHSYDSARNLLTVWAACSTNCTMPEVISENTSEKTMDAFVDAGTSDQSMQDAAPQDLMTSDTQSSDVTPDASVQDVSVNDGSSGDMSLDAMPQDVMPQDSTSSDMASVDSSQQSSVCNPVWHYEISGVCVPKKFVDAKDASGNKADSVLMWSYVKYDYRDAQGVTQSMSESRIWFRCGVMLCLGEEQAISCSSIKWATFECHNPTGAGPCKRDLTGFGAKHGSVVKVINTAMGDVYYYVDAPQDFDGAYLRNEIQGKLNGSDPTKDDGPGWPICWRKEFKEFVQIDMGEYQWRPAQIGNPWISRPKMYTCSLTSCAQ